MTDNYLYLIPVFLIKVNIGNLSDIYILTYPVI